MSVLDEIFSSNDEMDIKQKIVEELLNPERNLETKTELNKPLKWSCLHVIDDFIKDHKMPVSSGILNSFMNTSFKYLISNQRNGRKEYIEALKSLSHFENEQKPNLSSLMKG